MMSTAFYFNPRSPCGERTAAAGPLPPPLDFNPRSPCGERTAIYHHRLSDHISIHAPHAGSDTMGGIGGTINTISIHAPHAGSEQNGRRAKRCYKFQSTLPMRGASALVTCQRKDSSISIHAPHAGSEGGEASHKLTEAISIHAPHAGSDQRAASFGSPTMISIHAPHAGSD